MIHRNKAHVQDIRGGIKAKREQYVLRHYVGCTLHSAMGQTLATLVTKVCRGRNQPYSLWMAPQVVVLLSRTKYGRDTIIVAKKGKERETAEFLYSLLMQTTRFRRYIDYLLDMLCSKAPALTDNPKQTIQLNQYNHYLRIRDVPLPSDNTGYVYILISTVNLVSTYIGSTANLVERLKDHNSGYGGRQTAPSSLRPWAILAYVTGFDADEASYKTFETLWLAAKNRYVTDPTLQPSVQGVVELANDILQEEEWEHDLKLIHSGTLSGIRQHAPNI